MNYIRIAKTCLKSIVLPILIFLSFGAVAQTDTTKPIAADTTKPVMVDSTKAATPDTSQPAAKAKTKKKKNEFILYGGVNFNNADVAATNYKSEAGTGYHLGVAYKRGSFFYWQVGARYNSAKFNFISTSSNTDTSDISVNALDLPLTVGINFLSFANRLLGLRAFVSLVPSFTMSVPDNELGIAKDDVNSFIFYGQAGIGFNVAFVLIDVGYNYGFQDMYKNYSGSNPGQAFVSLGFRF